MTKTENHKTSRNLTVDRLFHCKANRLRWQPDLSADKLTSTATALLFALLTFVISVEGHAACSSTHHAAAPRSPIAAEKTQDAERGTNSEKWNEVFESSDDDFQEKAILANQDPLQFRRFALNQIRDIEQLADDLGQGSSVQIRKSGATATEDHHLSGQHTDQRTTQLSTAIKELRAATQLAKASLMRDTRLQTVFSRERLRSDLFTAQDAAQVALELSYDKLPAMEVASAANSTGKH